MAVAVNCVGERNVPVPAWPPKFTVDPLTNPLPVTAIWNRPTPMLLGLIAVNTGSGFYSVTALLPCFGASAALVAVIVIAFGLGSAIGALYIPCAEIIPV